jgi:hypothetical protein
MNNETKQTFDAWCIVELFGHTKIAGRCTEQNIAGTNFLRVDVPETEKQPAFSRFLGAAAIYAINPVDEKTAIICACEINTAPIMSWQGESFTEKFKQQPKALGYQLPDDREDDIV